jgi:hypothetical protein
VKEVYNLVVSSEYKTKSKSQREEVINVKTALDGAHEELSNARKLLLSNDIEPSDYCQIKAGYEKKIARFEASLIDFSQNETNIELELKKALSTLSRLDEIYEDADNEKKREIISSIYPEKLTFNGFNY